MSRRVYFRINSVTLDSASSEVTARDYEVYTSASHAEAGTPNEEITSSTRTSDGGNYKYLAYTNTSEYAPLNDMFPTGTDTGDLAYEYYFYNATGSTIYLSSDYNSTTPTTMTDGSWNTPTSGNGYNPWENYGISLYTVNTTTDLYKYTIINVSTPGNQIFMYITGRSGTATSTTNINYQLFSRQDYSGNKFLDQIGSTVTGGTSLALYNSFTPDFASGATYQYVSLDPSSINIYVHESNYSATDGGDTYRFYRQAESYNPSYLLDWNSYTGWAPNATDGSSAGSGTETSYYTYLDSITTSSNYLYWEKDSSTSSAGLAFFTFTAVCFPPFTLIETPNGLTQIVDLKVGDEVKTQGGIVKVSKNMTTHTPGGATFVFFPKNCICEGFPSEDAYITEFHPIAIKNVEEDNKDVMHFIEARHFINKFEGIELKKLETKTYHNLVFDTVEIFNVGGMKMCSHHPNNTPIKLRKDEFLGEVNEREPVNLYYTFEKLLEDKKEDEDLGEFIKNIFIYN